MTSFRSVSGVDMPSRRMLASRIRRSASLGFAGAPAVHGSAARSDAAGSARRQLDLAGVSSVVEWNCAIFLARATPQSPNNQLLQRFGETRDMMPRKLGPPSGATEGGSEAAGQQERSPDGGATSGSEASRCKSKPKVSRDG